MANFSYSLYIKPNYVKSNGKTPIYIRYYEKRNHRTLLDTGLEINPKHWSVNKNYPKTSKINIVTIKELESKKLKLANIISDAINKDIIPTTKYIRNKFYSEDLIIKSSKKLSFFEELDDYINSKRTKVVNDVIKDYKSLRKHLKGFEEHTQTPITFKTINLDFYNEFIEYLTYHVVKKNGEIGLLTNSIGKQIKNLKAFLNNRIKLKKIEKIDLTGFLTLVEEVDDIYLSKNELERIDELNLANQLEIQVRDLLIIGCTTGLRYGDLMRVNKNQFRDGLLFIRQKKVHKSLVIPIKSRTKEILEKYNYTSPKVAINVFNNLVKKIGEKASIDQVIETVYKRGNRKEITKNKKFELISSHTCRRSFCTNEYLDGTPVHLIMKISGHKTEKSFMRYLKISEYEAALKMKEAWLNA